jgi:hypothetical protein
MIFPIRALLSIKVKAPCSSNPIIWLVCTAPFYLPLKCDRARSLQELVIEKVIVVEVKADGSQARNMPCSIPQGDKQPMKLLLLKNGSLHDPSFVAADLSFPVLNLGDHGFLVCIRADDPFPCIRL